MKIETIGETTALERIPPGAIVPKKRAQIGIVSACAPTDCPKDFPALEGRAASKGFVTNSLKANIPAKAPYESINESSYMSGVKAQI